MQLQCFVTQESKAHSLHLLNGHLLADQIELRELVLLADQIELLVLRHVLADQIELLVLRHLKTCGAANRVQQFDEAGSRLLHFLMAFGVAELLPSS